jgi:hypothetical protein
MQELKIAKEMLEKVLGLANITVQAEDVSYNPKMGVISAGKLTVSLGEADLNLKKK